MTLYHHFERDGVEIIVECRATWTPTGTVLDQFDISAKLPSLPKAELDAAVADFEDQARSRSMELEREVRRQGWA